MWAWIAMAAASVLKGLGSYSQQKAENASLKYQAAMNRINARMENLKAEEALRQGEKQQQQIMLQTEKLKGQQLVGYAASGIDLSSRSAQNVMNETDFFGEVDKNQAAANAIAASWSHRLNATNMEGNASIQLAQRKNAFGVALNSALTGALSGAASMSSWKLPSMDTASPSQSAGFDTPGGMTTWGGVSTTQYGKTLLGGAQGASSGWFKNAYAQSGYIPGTGRTTGWSVW